MLTRGANDPRLFKGNRPAVRCSKGFSKFLDACEIHVDRGSGYVHLVTDTTPNYTDSHPWPATKAIGKYKATFRVDDTQAGQWSIEHTAVVGG